MPKIAGAGVHHHVGDAAVDSAVRVEGTGETPPSVVAISFTTFPCVTSRLTGKLSATVVFELKTASNGVDEQADGLSGSTTRIRP